MSVFLYPEPEETVATFELLGTWVDVTPGYDAPAGEKLRFTYRVEVPWWLEWTPDYIMDFLVTSIGNIWAEIQSAVVDFEVTSHEVNIVETGKTYEILIYGVSRGVAPLVVAAIILGLLVVALIVLTVIQDKVQRFVEYVIPPALTWAIPISIVLVSGAALGAVIIGMRRR